MSPLEVGVVLPTTRLDLAQKVESLGFDSLWIPEHIVHHLPWAESTTSVAAFAAVTNKVRIGTAVMIMPLRNPVICAKTFATLDTISSGRFVAGLGVGGENAIEFDACGIPTRDRGRRTDEAIDVMRLLWKGEPATFEGRFFSIKEALMLPPPSTPGGPPIWIGGRSEAAQRRAAVRGAGYLPYLFDTDTYQRAMVRIREHAAAIGKNLDNFEWGINLQFRFGRSEDEAHGEASGLLESLFRQPANSWVRKFCALGPPTECLARMQSFADVGVTHIVAEHIGSPDELESAVEILSRDVLPALKGG